MAEIVYGFGSSHGPLLSTAPEKWDLRAQADMENPAHPFRGEIYNYEELRELRKDENLGDQNQLSVRQERHERNQKQMDALAEKIAEVEPDIVVVVGDDQHEWFQDDIQPSFTVYHGEKVINTALDQEKMKTVQPGLAISMCANHPGEDHAYPVPVGLAHAIIEQAIGDEFDIATSSEQPKDEKGLIGIGHAVGFIYRRILRDKPVPVVPILLNTFFPPNQPTPRRCYRFGQSIGRAIRGWNSDKRVAICASGGISHFVIDEDFDNRILKALLQRDEDAIFNEPNAMFRSGTSETKNWIAVAGILSGTDLEMDLLDYVPCYRTEAGTGNAMAFATWT
ncbi:MAG: hypothetical protein QF393_18545 [Rhodospirillales bacterium]|jgi:OH-DDVA oxygenase/3-O-methylgallate 3,4-dioxygenase|nr:hypothetical protein [Rhodospirillales bacterium]MDP6645590.1 hypothetical protein [Rhodospirillales bacterium]|tara:strand:+ start:1140 stop:2150 length:1011 start_codon:yes stop_codon:yes gene_type:complete